MARMFRRKADVIIDRAHAAVGSAEILLSQARTDAEHAHALDELFLAGRFQARAYAARDLWDRTEHDEYEEYPDVPERDQTELF